MKLSVAAVAAGLVLFHFGLWLAAGTPAVILSAGLLLVAGGLLLDLENE
jgi:hypothetical protein